MYFKELDTKANENAKNDVFNKLEEKLPEGLSENGKVKYQTAYASYKKAYQDEIENVEAKIREQAKIDAEKKESRNDESYEEYKDYEIYKDMKKLYDDVYSENRESNPLDIILGLGIIVGFIALIVYLVKFVNKKIKNIIKRFKK